MATYIKLASGLVQLDTPITSESISTALGYMPSNFSGDYNDLTNKPIDGDVLTSEQSVFYIADKNDNIIALIDSAGIHSIDVDVNGISVKETLSSLDTGITSTENSLNSHKSNTTIHITTEEREKWNRDPLDSEDSELYITDNNGNILALFNSNGLTITAIQTDTINGIDAHGLATNDDINTINSTITAIKTKTDNIEASENDSIFVITDDLNYPIAQFDESGLTVTAIKTDTINGIDAHDLATTNYVDTEIAGLVNGAPEALDTLKELGDALATHEDAYDALLEIVGNKVNQTDFDTHVDNFNEHTGDTTVHITAAERSTWNQTTEDFNGHTQNTDIHITATERAEWNEVKDRTSNIETSAEETSFQITDKDGANTIFYVDQTDARAKDFTAEKGSLNTTIELINTHIANIKNPHGVTAAQIGLDKVNNTSDLEKPISTAAQAALDLKANQNVVDEHISNTTIHVTESEKTLWDTTAENTEGIEHTTNGALQITDESGNHTIFYLDEGGLTVPHIKLNTINSVDFNNLNAEIAQKVTDVKVNGTSVVGDTVANIDLDSKYFTFDEEWQADGPGEGFLPVFSRNRTPQLMDSNIEISSLATQQYVEDEISAINITYSELKTLKDNSNLVPGKQYRITDYTCTTSITNTSSAGHVFDILVVADSENTLNENARAIQHEGDTYFANNKLSAWELKYSLENNTDRFTWANSTNGKGVIYYMKDEFNNECPYDFKNILFTGSSYKGLVSFTNAYTFTYTENSTLKDASILGSTQGCYNNVIKEYYSSTKLELNWIIFYSTSTLLQCYGNTFGLLCANNTFGHYCSNNTFGNDCIRNTFGHYCYKNTFGTSGSFNTFGDFCGYNTFGSNCNNNTFGEYCSTNILGNHCTYNTFGENCNSNTFVNNCNYITFGNYCQYNTFGISCNSITFGTAPAINYCWYNIIDNGCSYLFINSADTAAHSGNYLQNVHIHLGVSGSSSETRKTITIPDRNLQYEYNVVKAGTTTVEIS